MATIYIVEDDVNIREIERYALKNSGYEVEEFESGESLFKRLERAVPSLLLLDIMLPDEDGLEILGKLCCAGRRVRRRRQRSATARSGWTTTSMRYLSGMSHVS